jgi:hypothetical protein
MIDPALRKAARLARQRSARQAKLLKRRCRALVKPMHMQVEWMAFVDALLHPTWSQSANELLAVEYASAHGGDQTRQCFGCCQLWTADRVPLVFLSIAMLEVGIAMVMGVCAECVATGDITRLVHQAIARDFGVKSPMQVVAAAGYA